MECPCSVKQAKLSRYFHTDESTSEVLTSGRPMVNSDIDPYRLVQPELGEIEDDTLACDRDTEDHEDASTRSSCSRLFTDTGGISTEVNHCQAVQPQSQDMSLASQSIIIYH